VSPGDPPTDVRILLIDDDPDQRLVVGGLLAQRGFKDVTEAEDAETGLRLAAHIVPHLILLDLVMPGRSGAEMLPDLRAATPNALIVVLSNMPRRRLLDPMLRRGAVGYVEKSVSPLRLVDEILMAAALTDMARTHVLGLSSSTTSARVARHFARDLLADADRRLISDIELLVSELITNAVVHTRTEPRLEIHLLRDAIRVEVYDDDPVLPVRREPDINGPGGRGLHMVSKLSSKWGAESVGDGKVVWFQIDHPEASL
jgi:CheY-like chemotaxis protein